MKTKTICVTEENIRKGRRRSGRSCPVALAIRRAFKTKNVNVGFLVTVGKMNYTYPRKVDEFICKFDNEKTVNPMSFVLKEEPNVSID
jgi:sulfatase maturation enzyme AslB (radical SAM superfamily)